MKFEEKVWKLLKKIPRGKVTTYKLLGRKLNSRAYRAIGQACRRNPFAPRVPCHRVVSSSGLIGGYSAKGGLKKKIELLEKEGINIRKNRIMDFKKVLFRF